MQVRKILSGLLRIREPRDDVVQDRVLFAMLFAVVASFAWWNRPFVNYAYDYLHYIPAAAAVLWTVAFFLVGVTLPRKAPDALAGFIARHKTAVSLAAVVLFGLGFWFFSTTIHVFSGDGVDLTVPSRPFPGFVRLGDVVLRHFHDALWRVMAPASVEVLPAFFSSRCHSVLWGTLTVAVLLITCRREPGLAAAILTSFWLLNFFGNLDSYAFPNFCACAFWGILREFRRATPEPTYAQAAVLLVLWGVGMWAHPFLVFLGFFLIEHLHPLLRRHGIRLKVETMYALFGMAAFLLLGVSRFCTPLRTLVTHSIWDSTDYRHTYSVFALFPQTFIHYVNNLAFPLLPWIAYLALRADSLSRLKGLGVILCFSSSCFFFLYFVLGCVDQFIYYHLLCVLSLYVYDACSRNGLQAGAYVRVAVLNLFLLAPMVWVHHSGPLTLARAWRIYPHDLCHTHEMTSWQAQLGMRLGVNIQPSDEIERNTLEVLRNGAAQSETVDQPRNRAYLVAWHYHFGRIEEGRRLLAELVRDCPQAVGYVLDPRPASILFNADLFREDLLAFFPRSWPTVYERVRRLALDGARAAASNNPYYIRPSPYRRTAAGTPPKPARPPDDRSARSDHAPCRADDSRLM